MTGGGPYNKGGHTQMGTKVLLHIYDLSPSNSFLYPVGLGLHHSGVEVFGAEYSFASGAGVFDSSTPRDAGPGAQFRETYELGIYTGSMSELRGAISEIKDQGFGPDEYHLIRRNCNHFANAFVWKLLNKPIPAHVNRLAEIGVCCSCLLPKKLMEQAPVGDTTSSSGYQMYAPRGRISDANNNKKKMTTFSGTGAKLGSGAATSLLMTSRSGSPREDDLIDRRERARKAAMARMGKTGN
mmetsp:Transcript_23884/g.26378  ORF Transcript_23884/g.26378 Transcript_23884/m.26378 type:complete len:240 (+) Transcript_23884:39-758(+)